jgi:hypothetical protein
MKSLVLSIITLLCITLINAQTTENSNPDKILKLGFNIGANYSQLKDQSLYKPPIEGVKNDFGIRLGITSEIKLNDYFSTAPKFVLSFDNGAIQAPTALDGVDSYKRRPGSIEIMNHFVFRFNSKKNSPFIYFGPNFKLPISSKGSVITTEFKPNNDLAIDFGVGLENKLPFFSLTPELRYSFGLLDINTNPVITGVKFHNIALILNFTD